MLNKYFFLNLRVLRNGGVVCNPTKKRYLIHCSFIEVVLFVATLYHHDCYNLDWYIRLCGLIPRWILLVIFHLLWEKQWSMWLWIGSVKGAHFIALNHPYTSTSIAQAFLDTFYKLDGFSRSIVSDEDAMFVSIFGRNSLSFKGVL